VAAVATVADSAERAAVEFAVVEVRHFVQPAVPWQQVEQEQVALVLLAEHYLRVREQQSVVAVYSDRPR
jgi:hypothetical protein